MIRRFQNILMLALLLTSLRAFGVVAGDVDHSGKVDAMDVQLVINSALRLPVGIPTDIDLSGNTDAMDVQLVINAALALSIDTDNDGLCDAAEARLGTNPQNSDTDGDGITDGQEIVDGTDPLVPGVSAPPSVVTFVINKGTSETTLHTVTLDNVCIGRPTHYMASQLSDFSDAGWQTYATAPSFTLSAGTGTKKVFFKVKNTSGESEPVNDTIATKDGATLQMMVVGGKTVVLDTQTGTINVHSTSSNPVNTICLPFETGTK